jgi:basic membrane lipoprotein Med (substrate-binding protein (PBP1-ABC) superfamily)
MKVYENEKKDGLEAIISSNASLAYLTKLEIGSDDKADLAKLYETLAVKKDMSNYGLHPMKSILVSSVWNLNDDVFTGEELLAAKDTPRNKPLNIGHDQKEIVGHMTDCHVIDDEGKTVDVTLAEKDLPKKIHILADSFIYTHWYEDEQKAKVDELLEDIKAGKYCVSMECVFSDFDYALKDAKGAITIVKRDEGTSWMTKHLAVYKGSGSLIGQQIGRVPRNVSFNGIGIVKDFCEKRGIY